MTLNGIDIASHQAGLNCATIPADFIIVKISQGTKYVNPLWDKWAGQILNSGKKLGFYHYASGGDPIAEANYFWTYAKKYAGRAVFFLDWEAGYNNSLPNTTLGANHGWIVSPNYQAQPLEFTSSPAYTTVSKLPLSTLDSPIP